jgi:hypothetical protein
MRDAMDLDLYSIAGSYKNWLCGPSVSSPANLNATRAVRLKSKEDARGSKHRHSLFFLAECQLSYMFQSVAVV